MCIPGRGKSSFYVFCFYFVSQRQLYSLCKTGSLQSNIQFLIYCALQAYDVIAPSLQTTIKLGFVAITGKLVSVVRAMDENRSKEPM